MCAPQKLRTFFKPSPPLFSPILPWRHLLWPLSSLSVSSSFLLSRRDATRASSHSAILLRIPETSFIRSEASLIRWLSSRTDRASSAVLLAGSATVGSSLTSSVRFHYLCSLSYVRFFIHFSFYFTTAFFSLIPKGFIMTS